MSDKSLNRANQISTPVPSYIVGEKTAQRKSNPTSPVTSLSDSTTTPLASLHRRSRELRLPKFRASSGSRNSTQSSVLASTTRTSATRTRSSPSQALENHDLFDEIHSLINEVKSLPTHPAPSTLDATLEDQVSFDDVLREFETKNNALPKFVKAAIGSGGLVDAYHALPGGSQDAKEKIEKFYKTAKQLKLTWPEILGHAKLAAVGNSSAEELKKLSELIKIGEKFGSRLFYNPEKQ